MLRSLQHTLLVLTLAASVSTVRALPPPAAASAAADAARWIEHRVIRGERLVEIARRYGVAVTNILQWNELQAPKPLLRAGQKLRIYTAAPASERRRKLYSVRDGDSWSRIARRFDVDQTRLRRDWNPDLTELTPGDEVVVWIDREPKEVTPERTLTPTPTSTPTPTPTPTPSATLQPTTLTSITATPSPARVAPKPLPLALVPLPTGHAGRSVGTPTRGRLLGGVQLPEQPALYTIRNPENSYGTSLAVATLQTALADFRQDSGYDRELVVCDMSRERGGRFRPHRSHTSGRDVDIRLPLRQGLPDGTIPVLASQVDWDAAWRLVKSLIDTGQVRYVFLARPRQKPLYDAARRAGESQASLETLIQYPRRKLAAVVRHSAGHVKHIHVRFRCAPDETQCVDP
jgi:transposase-like protein